MNHCKTIAIVNQKGGVGKTTSTVNLGVGLAQAGNRVLLVDDDPQHSLTISLGIRNADEDLDTTLATAMEAEIRDESVPWEEGIIHSDEGVDLLPANIELSGVEMSLFNAMSREQVLKSVLSRVKENYDYILIDCMLTRWKMTWRMTGCYLTASPLTPLPSPMFSCSIRPVPTTQRC